MSSNNRLNNMLPTNIKIKTEPGTSRFSNIIPDHVIKIEPGSSQRLSSLKLPRDLKLGGPKSKIIKPNLNVVRNKRTDVPSPANNRARGRVRTRGSDRGRGAHRGRQANVVQSYGVFSEGISEALKRKAERFSDRLREDKDYDATKVMDRPTINKNIEWKVDKQQEDMIMDELLSIHIEPDEMDVANDLHPITLPISKSIEKKTIVKLEQLIKTEEGTPPENDLGEKKIFDAQEKLLLFQFPDTLPGIGPSIESESTPSTSANVSEKNSEETQAQNNNKCTLQDITEGLLGKVVIYKSGKTKLVIGNNRFDIELGPESGFLQDVMSVPINSATKSGDMINLGSLEGNVIITPEWGTLLSTD